MNPLKNALKKYFANSLWIIHLITIFMFIKFLNHRKEFHSVAGQILTLIPIVGAFSIPIIFTIIWYFQEKKK